MHWLRRALLAAALALSPAPVDAQDFEAVEIETLAVAPGLFMLTGRGGNIGVSVGDDGVFLIDDQYAPLTAKIRTAVAKLSTREIRFVLNTHWHADHTGGNENLGQAGALIVAHENVRARMSAAQFQRLLQRSTPPAPAAALPIVTFSDTVTFHMNGDEIHAVHTGPAHTDGDSIVHFERANAIHAGDVFFNGFYPFIDLDSGGSVEGMIAAAERALALADAETKVIPGHGPLSDAAGLRDYRAMLVTARDRVRALVREGKSADQVVAAKPTADLDATWGGGFMTPERFVRILYADLSR